MIYVFCPDDNTPSGGIRVLYRLVDTLNNAGMPACILHLTPGFRVTWFPNTTPVRVITASSVGENDIMVMPELYGDQLKAIAPHVPRVIFNQGTYLTWETLTPGTDTPYQHPNLLGALTVSQDGYDYLKYSFPQLDVQRIHIAMSDRFKPEGELTRAKTISYMPRRRAVEIKELLSILAQRGSIDGWEIESIDNYTEKQTVEAMRRTSIFLAFSIREGFPIPPGEAMASGCLVVGYHGRGARETFLPEHSFPVEDGDVVTYAKTIESITSTWDDQVDHYMQMRQDASNFMLSNFSIGREKDDIVRVFRDFTRKVAKRNGIVVANAAGILTQV